MNFDLSLFCLNSNRSIIGITDEWENDLNKQVQVKEKQLNLKLHFKNTF